MDYEKIAEYQIELERLAKIPVQFMDTKEKVKVRARELELRDLIVFESTKPTL
jgi:hypothetical protein